MTNATTGGSPSWRRRSAILIGSAVVIIALGIGVIAVATSPGAAPPIPARTDPPIARPTPIPIPVVPPAPVQSTQEQLATLPLAFYDAVIPQLLDGSTVTPTNLWKVATPLTALVGLYSSSASAATPVAALANTVRTVNRPTAVAVFGISGDMILISTPSRNRTPGPGAPAASATFAWARTADFTLTTVTQTIYIDNQTSVISIQDASGTVSTSEIARLGSPADPTPTGTSTYIEADYVDRSIAYTRGNPIALTGAHSSALSGYGGNSALTALHFFPAPTGSSHGCVRISAAMTNAIAALPVGTPIIFS